MDTGNFALWLDSPLLSIAAIIMTCVVLMYLARTQSHKLIISLATIVHRTMRVASRALRVGEEKLVQRNREVLLASGAVEMERKIERNFERMSNIVQQDLGDYPSMHRSISDLVTRIDEDYRKTADAPPPPPEWVGAVEAVAAINKPGDTLVAGILDDINKAVEKHQKNAISEYRKTSSTRHTLLKRMMPYWRRVAKALERSESSVSGLIERSGNVDVKIQQYEDILAGSQRAERTLSSSSLTQFFVSAIVLAIALGGAIVNFNLIALPMSEMVGGGTYIGPFKMNHVAAMVIILLESATGIYLMEALRITSLFPIIGTMEDRKRKLFIWASVIILLIMASIEASLGFMRDIISTNNQAFMETLAGGTTTGAAEVSLIPLIGQMVLGFILPFVLAFVAIPFESFIHASRTMIGMLAVWTLRAMGFVFRVIGALATNVGVVLVNVYDLLIFPFIRVESFMKRPKNMPKQSVKEVQIK